MTADSLRQPLRTPWFEVALAALPAAAHALIFLGRLHPDEVFQSLEIALNRVYGFGILPWEWQMPANPQSAPNPWGIRNHAVPMILAACFRSADLVGLNSVMGRRFAAEVPQYLLHTAMLGAVWRLSARRVGNTLARACLWLTAFYGPVMWFGGRTMSESFSTAFLVWGLERLDSQEEKSIVWVWGGALLGFAQVTRYGSAAVILPTMLFLLFARRFRTAALATLGGLTVAVALGLLDKLTWGEWFHSFIHYVRFNVISGNAAAQFGAQPWWSYFPRLLVAPWAAIGLIFTVRKDRWLVPVGTIGILAAIAAVASYFWLPMASPWFGFLAGGVIAALLLRREENAQGQALFIAAALGYLAIVSATAHKEDRFIYPVLVLLTVVGTCECVAWVTQGPRRWKTVTTAFATAAGAAFFVLPSPFDVQRKEQFQLAVKASHDATGLVIMNEGVWGSPGFFYLGKNIPWCTCDFPHEGCFQVASRDHRFNRGIYWSSEATRDAKAQAAFEAAGFQLTEQRGLAWYFER